MTTDTNNPDAFTPEEQAYFENNGVTPENEEAAAVEEAGAEENTADAEAVTEDTQDGDAEDSDGGAKKNDTVPHGAFHAKNEELKQTKAKLRELETQMAVVNDRFERFSQMQASKQDAAPAEEIPGDDDPIGLINYLKKQVEDLQQGSQKQQQLTQQEQQIKDFKQAISWEEQQYMQEVTDYTDATKHLGNILQNSLVAQGFQGAQLQQKYQNELLNIALNAKEAGRSVPEVIYQLAQNYGYRKAEPEPVQQEEAQSEEVKETLEKVAAGQKANKTPGNGGGSAGGKMTLERFANMPEAEAFAWMEKNPGGYNKLLAS